MLHLFFDGKPWFRVKRVGYGAGLPIAWQGWVLMLSYLAAFLGLAVLAERTRGMALAGVIVGILLLTAVFIGIARARSDAEWRWRSGEND